MQSYLNDQSLKDKTIAAMQADVKAEALVQGNYWNGTNGCFVGCVIRGDSHADFELKLGVPRLLARLADRIFEGLPYKEAKKFSVDFLKAIPVGADLASVWPKFAVFILVDKDFGVLRYAKKDKTKKAIQDVADLYQRIINGEKIDANMWLEARRKAAAAYAADAGADADADAARSRHFAAFAERLIQLLSEAA